jgi:hypothetical protein
MLMPVHRRKIAFLSFKSNVRLAEARTDAQLAMPSWTQQKSSEGLGIQFWRRRQIAAVFTVAKYSFTVLHIP